MMALRIPKTSRGITNIPGVLENGLFVDLIDKVLVGKLENNSPVVYSPQKSLNL